MIIIGAALALVGAALFLWSLARVLRANATTPVPYYRAPSVAPTGAVPQRAQGAGLMVFGAVWSSAVPPLLIALVLIGPLAALAAVIRHNRRIASLRA